MTVGTEPGARFADRTVLVTGATGGIGRATCKRLADEGARIAAHYVSSEDAADELLAALPGAGHGAFRADLMDPGERGGLVPQVVDAMGGLDVLVNNAGLYEEHPLADLDLDAWRDVWRRTLELNLLACAELSYQAARHMIDHGGGAIVNISSRGAFRGEPDAPAYGASKAGLNALTQSLANALAPHKVVVAAVAPGFVETPMVAHLLEGPEGEAIRAQSPTGRVARPEEVAAVVAFLASGEAPFATGTIVDVNGASYLRT